MIETLLANPAELFEKNLEQIIRFCGRGKLTDGSVASAEFRRVIRAAPDEVLERFAHTCLVDGFKDSGLALQDIMNDLARRLGFRVEFGRYRGRKGDLAPDGVWFEPSSEFALVVEIKTTDAYRISLDRLAEFRDDTCRSHQITLENSSTLVIVGRKDTGEFEAQIRGSRHAWSTRLVSVDALFNVLKLIDAVEDDRTIARVCEVLRPREYTRVDGIIDLAFAAAVDARDTEQLPEDESNLDEASAVTTQAGANSSSEPLDVSKRQRRTSLATIAEQRVRAVQLLEHYTGNKYLKKSKTLWATDSGQVALVMYSKLHERDETYWYGYHRRQEARLDGVVEPSHLVLICGNRGVIVVSLEQLRGFLGRCYRTVRGDETKSYWHLKVRCEVHRPSYFVGHQGKKIAEVEQFLAWNVEDGS